MKISSIYTLLSVVCLLMVASAVGLSIFSSIDIKTDMVWVFMVLSVLLAIASDLREILESKQ